MKPYLITLGNNDCLVENGVNPRSTMQSKLILSFLIFYITLPFIEAPLRYYLAEHDIPWAIYIRDVLIVLFGLWFILKNCFLIEYEKTIYYLICILIFHSIIGIIYLPDYFMVLFGWKIFLPILIGLGSYYVVIQQLNKIKTVFGWLFLISVVGIFINYFVEFPWEGFTYDLDVFKIEATRLEEITFGIKRLAGFNRFAFDAATNIILVSIFLVVHIKNNTYKIITWIVAGLALLLTTVKGILLSYVLISILLVIQAADNRVMEYYKIYRKLFLMLLIIAIMLPFMSYFSLYFANIKLPDDIKDLVLTSFNIRIYEKWPEVIDIIQNYGNLVLGRGLGGIGQSQVFFENYLFYSADNIFLYIYAQFGVLGFYYLFYFYLKSRSLNANRELFYCLLVFIILQYGITQSILESPSLCLFLGFLLAHLNNSKLRVEYQKQLEGMK